MSKWRQRGFNVLWPWEIETWRLGEKVPEWLGDIARVKWIDGDGNLTLDIELGMKGGYGIKAAGIGQENIVRVPEKSDYVYIPRSMAPPSCFPCCQSPSLRTVSSISPELLEILYEKII